MAQKTATMPKTISASQSIHLVKNLFRAAFHSIAFIRGFFGKECFKSASVGFRYKEIIGKDSRASLFRRWLEEGVFDALEKRHLEYVYLRVHERDPNAPRQAPGQLTNPQQKKLRECYKFKVSYHENKVKLNISGWETEDLDTLYSRNGIRKQATEMVHSILDKVSGLGVLPKYYLVSINLLYTPETPEEYEPPMFGKAECDEDFWFSESPFKIDLGKVLTPHNTVQMSVYTEATAERNGKALGGNNGNKKEGNETQLVDMEGCDTNSGRAFARKTVRDSQELDKKESEGPSTKCKLRIKAGEDKPKDKSEDKPAVSGLSRQNRKRKKENMGSAAARTEGGVKKKLKLSMPKSGAIEDVNL